MPRRTPSHDGQRNAGDDTRASDPAQHGACIVVPIRSFLLGNTRLARSLDDDARVALARRMADAVADAAGARTVVVVTSAAEVEAWCRERNLATLPDPGTLDAAADAGRAYARDAGFTRVVIVHGDLPNARSLDQVANDGAAAIAVLVPDHRGDGTPVCSVPCASRFEFAYGPGSFERHRRAAAAAGLDLRIVTDPNLAFDVDVPEDLARLRSPAP
jgi:2-phospho-L-lactate guanylyltransferase